jgi:hypothetical protein
MFAVQSGCGFSRIIRSSAVKAAATLSMKSESDVFKLHGATPHD